MNKTILFSSLVINLIFLSTTVFAQSDEVKAQMAERVEKAEQLIDSPEWHLKKEETVKEIESLLQQNLKEVPEDSETLRVYTVLLRDISYVSDDKFEMQLLQKALELIHRSINSDPKNQSAIIEKCYLLVTMKNPEAKNFLYSSNKDFDKSKMQYRQARKLMRSFYELKDKTNGDVYYDLALKLASGSKEKASIHVSKANYWHNEKNYDKCIEEYKLAISLDDKKPWPFGNVSNCFLEKNRLDESIEYAKKALAIMNYENARLTLYRAYVKKASQFKTTSDWKKAEENYLLAAQAYTHFEPYLYLIEVYIKMNDIKKAKETGKTATKFTTQLTNAQGIENKVKAIFAENKIAYP